jgi:hypothetical protein
VEKRLIAGKGQSFVLGTVNVPDSRIIDPIYDLPGGIR